ncbi:MAG: isoamylase early set domain-containing protein [Caldilineaceae bacterium]|nr:isoamylase early set domain-containing protein [Caldilineaceae bacterium]
MIHKMPSPRSGHVRVVFELPACIWADRIFLVGDFNGWSKDITPFIQGRDGVWRAAMDLVAGRSYQFRYLVDGAWQTDYHADGWIDNQYGSQNSIVNAALDIEQVSQVEQSSLLHEELHDTARSRHKVALSPLVHAQRLRNYASSPKIKAAS